METRLSFFYRKSGICHESLEFGVVLDELGDGIELGWNV